MIEKKDVFLWFSEALYEFHTIPFWTSKINFRKIPVGNDFQHRKLRHLEESYPLHTRWFCYRAPRLITQKFTFWFLLIGLQQYTFESGLIILILLASWFLARAAPVSDKNIRSEREAGSLQRTTTTPPPVTALCGIAPSSILAAAAAVLGS